MSIEVLGNLAVIALFVWKGIGVGALMLYNAVRGTVPEGGTIMINLHYNLTDI